MKIKAIKALTVILLLTVVCSSIFAVIVSASENTDRYDFSKEGSFNSRKFNSADILESYLGEELLRAEREYLVSYGGVAVTYDDTITTANINSILENGKLTVLAYEYMYESKNGTNVVWIPDRVTLGDDIKSFTELSGEYYAEFSGVEEEGPYQYINVEYILEIKIDKDDVNYLLNKAKGDIPLLEKEIEDKRAEYEKALENYNHQLKIYDEYLSEKAEYDKKLENYEQYLKDYRIYKESLDAYNEYLVDLGAYEIAKAEREAYEKALAVYEKEYSLYLDYLAERLIYEEGVALYEEYVKKIRRFRNCLQIINYTDRTMTKLERSIRKTVYGTVVDTILDERDKLESNMVGAPAGVIELAGKSTESLRSLINGYFEYETEQGRYSYYLEYYESFKKSFVDLFSSLDYLYRNPSICAILYEKEKDEKYRILLAQLYVVARAISDEPIKSVSPDLVVGGKGAEKYKQFTYTDDYKIDIYEYTVEEILGEENILVDTNSATPLNEPFPTEVICPPEPTPVIEPQKPKYVAPAVEVPMVEKPLKEPARVENPGESPKAVTAPQDKPREYTPPSEYTALIEEKSNLEERFNFANSSHTIVIRKTVSKKFINPSEVNVKFYSHINGEILYETTVDSGTAVNFSGEIPGKNEDEKATYTFEGWQNDDGILVDLRYVYSDLILYPKFTTHIKSYTVSFDVDGVITKKVIQYGSMPEYDAVNPKKADSEYLYYTFEEWDKELSPVSSDITYTAVFASHYIVPTSNYGASVSFDGENLVVNFDACYDRTFKLENALERAVNLGGMTIISPYCRLYLSYSNVLELYSLGASEVSIDFTESSGEVCSYLIKITDKNGESLSKDTAVKVYVPSIPFEINSRLALFTPMKDGQRRYSKFSVSNDGFYFNATSHVSYVLAYEYRLVSAVNNLADVSFEKEIYSSGESVAMQVTVPDGYNLARIYYFDQNGKKVDLKTLRFTMPDFDVTLVVDIRPVKYKVTFFNGNAILSSAYYTKGQMPIIPENPYKASDSEYDYTFVGWSEEVSSVSGDTVYHAVYSKTPINILQEEPELSFLEKLGNIFAELFNKIIRFFKRIVKK